MGRYFFRVAQPFRNVWEVNADIDSSSRLSLPARNTRLPLNGFSWNIIFGIFTEVFRNILFFLNRAKPTGTSHENLLQFLMCHSLLGTRNTAQPWRPKETLIKIWYGATKMYFACGVIMTKIQIYSLNFNIYCCVLRVHYIIWHNTDAFLRCDIIVQWFNLHIATSLVVSWPLPI
jgi:hypothetical protein